MSTGQESSPDLRRRRQLEWVWYGVALLYCGFRVLLADRYVRRFGLDVRAFAIVEFASTVPYAVGTAKLVGAFIDREGRKATIWALVASGGFLAPDVFTLLTTEHAPRRLVLVIVVWLCGAAALAVYRLRRSVLERRR